MSEWCHCWKINSSVAMDSTGHVKGFPAQYLQEFPALYVNVYIASTCDEHHMDTAV